MNQVVSINKDKKTIGQRHIFTQELMKVLRTVKEAETIEYEKISETIGINVKAPNNGYHYCKSARDILEKEEDMVFEAVENVGLRRMTPNEVAKSTVDKVLNEQRGTIKRGKRRIETVNDVYNELTLEAQEKTTITRTILAFMGELTKGKNIKKINVKVAETNDIIGFETTLELFMSKKV